MAVIFGLLPVLAYFPVLFGGHHEPDRSDEIAQLRAEVAQLREEREAPKSENAIHD